MAGFPGFDVSEFPGAATMAIIKRNTNLVWCGFYLGKTPSHDDDGWMDQRATLLDQGWKLVPIYVGQQTIPPGSLNPSAAQGTQDGGDAIRLLRLAGFPAGSCVYLDLENGPPLKLKLAAYVKTWVDAVDAGGFKPGVYCSHDLAARVHWLRPSARIWAFKVTTNDPHPVAGPPFPNPNPSRCGFLRAHIFQLEQNCQITVPGAGELTVDLDSALMSDPSA